MLQMRIIRASSRTGARGVSRVRYIRKEKLAMKSLATAVGIAFCALSTMAYAQGVVKLPEDIVFSGPPSGPPQTVVLYGDPAKSGIFVSRVRFSAGWKDMPHWHPDETRTVVVLSGTFYFGSGEKWDESKMKAYPAGTFYSEPPRAPHFTWAKDGEVIIQVTGIGPSGKTFIPQQ